MGSEGEIRRSCWHVWRKSLEKRLLCLVRVPTGSTGTVQGLGQWLTERVWRGRRPWGWSRQALRRSDAFTFFLRLEDAIVIGPTGNNLRDLRILIAEP